MSKHGNGKRRRVTTRTVRRKKARDERLVMVTAYDATFARLVDEAGVDMILVGDSLGNVIQGRDTTVPVTLDEMIYHCKCVSRGATHPMLIGDLPFGSYQGGTDDGMRSAMRMMKEGGVQGVKLEGGRQHADLVERLTSCGVPVMGHLGLTPQSVHAFGGFRVQAKRADAADRLLEDARILQDAGAFSIVLECVPAELAARVTAELDRAATIGIGAGVECDGQVLVIYDLIGMDDTFQPRFVKRYDTIGQRITDAVRNYAEEVRAASFPSDEHAF